MTALKIRLSLFLLIVFLASCSDSGTDQESVAATEVTETPIVKEIQLDTESLNLYFDALETHQKALGSFAIYKGGEMLFSRTLSNPPNTDVSQYKIGSITKTFTSVLAFKLIESGQLQLTNTLSQFYPQIPNAELITIDHLLNHRSGLFNYTNHQDFLSYYQQPQSREAMIHRLQYLPSLFEPGSKSEYSNSNYLLLGYILESVSQKSFAELLSEHITQPLSLTSTVYGSDSKFETQSLKSYAFTENSWQEIPQWDMSSAAAAGAIVSSTKDLNFFFHHLFSGDVLSPSSVEMMTQQTEGYGKGLFLKELITDKGKYIGYWHNGKIEDFYSYMIYFPEEKIGISALFNGLNVSATDIVDTLTEAAFGNEIVIPIFTQVELKPEQIEPFVGYYTSENFPLDLDIFIEEGNLMGQATGQAPFPLTATSPTEFHFDKAGIKIKFNSKNETLVIEQGGRSNDFVKSVKQEKQEVEVDTVILESYVGIYSSESFPLNIDVKFRDKRLFAQATGQPEFPLTARSTVKFDYDKAGITMEFDTENQTLRLLQAGNDILFKKESVE